MTPLESQIIKQLFASYQEKGVNPRLILDNPIFKHLPLQSRIDVIREYSAELTSGPSSSAKQVIISALKKGVIAGATTSAFTGLGQGFTVLNNSERALNLKNMAIAGAIGAGLGASNSLYQSYVQNKSDNALKSLLKAGDPIGVLSSESINNQVKFLPAAAPNAILNRISEINKTHHGNASFINREGNVVHSPSLIGAIRNILNY